MDVTTSARRRIAYNSWSNDRMLADLTAASSVPDDAMRMAGHLAGAERLWLGRLVHGSQTPEVWPDLTVDQLGAQLRELGHAWRGYGQSLSDARLDDPVVFQSRAGDDLSMSSLDILSHVLNHSTYHRGQIARILRQAGHDVTSTDWLRFALEEG